MKWLVAFALVFGACVLGGYQIAKSKTFQIFGEYIVRVDTDAPSVALTFDDGPTRKYTQALLDSLHQEGVSATFFVTGREAEANPEQMQAIVQAGHELGNHSYDYSRMVLMPVATVRKQLSRTDQAIRDAGYVGDIHFRPPYGKKLFSLPWVLAEQGRLSAMGDVQTDGDLGATAHQIVQNTVAQAEAGSIILLHGMYKSRQPTRDAIPAIIQGLRAKGLEPVTPSALLATRKK